MGSLNMTSLVHADKFVREGNLAAALALIRKVRRDDPSNRYAEAYEERVCALMGCPISLDEDSPEPADAQSSTPEGQSDVPLAEIVSLLSKAHEAFSQGDSSAALEILSRAHQLDPKNTDIPELEEQIRTASSAPATSGPDIHYAIVRDTIAAYIDEASHLASRGDFDNAMHLIAKGFVLDPMDEGLRECERMITDARALAARQEAELEAARKRVAQQEEEEARRASRLQQHIARARELLTSALYDEALTEVALGLVIDPESLSLHALEQVIWKEKNDHAAMEASARASSEHGRLIRLYLLSAEEFARGGEFNRALDDVAKAYTLDPTNTDVKRIEVKIRQQELRHHKQAAEPPLKLIYHHDRAANGE